jgi:hypothetical protein
MKQKDLKRLISAEMIYTISLIKEGDQWEVWMQGEKTEFFGGQLMTERETPKTYTSLDRAYEAMQALGYNGHYKVIPDKSVKDEWWTDRKPSKPPLTLYKITNTSQNR